MTTFHPHRHLHPSRAGDGGTFLHGAIAIAGQEG